MGWKGTLRSLQAASNRSARDAERRRKQQTKINAINQAATDVEEFNNDIYKLTSFHKTHREFIDWQVFIDTEEPIKPKKANFNREKQAKNKFENYNPGFIARTLNLENFQKERLRGKIDKAAKKDEFEFEEATKKYKEDHKVWSKNRKLAKRLQEGDSEAYKEALQKYEFLDNIEGVSISTGDYDFSKSSIPILGIQVPDIEIVPTVIKKQRASGSLSVRNMPISKRNEIYEDVVSSLLLRVGCEFLAIIPVELVIINGYINMVNTATGHKEDTPVLSIALSKNTVQRLNLENVDPSDAMDNFVYKSGFKKTKGFTKINVIDPKSLQKK